MSLKTATKKEKIKETSNGKPDQKDRAEIISEIEAFARSLRVHVIEMTTSAGSGHPGGSLSAVDIMATLYKHHLKHDPTNPGWADRDRFILSKGHAAPVLYAALAECGYFDVALLKTLRKLGSILQGHPDMKKVPGVDMSTGSLGNGIAAANGFALAAKMDQKDYRIFTVIGDGESQEGVVWEAAMFASHYNLDNIIAILDYNGLQIDGPTDTVMSISPVADKWRAFGWNVMEVNGHSINELLDAIEQAKLPHNKPTIIIARTVKGSGVSFMENQVDFHGKCATSEQMVLALEELGITGRRENNCL